MLRVTPSTHSEAAKKYFGENLTRSDYYMDGQEVTGLWGGKAAMRLGLDGQVDQKSYFALCDNLHPQTGTSLTPRTKHNRRVGFDFTFSAPKSVSAVYELSGDERILAAVRDSVRETMEEIEREMKTRVRKNGKDADRLTGNMVWAEFVHFTSRPVNGMPDPHLHVHCFAFNTTFDEAEARFKAGQFGDLKRDASYYEAAFDARLSHRLEALGYATQKTGYSFEIAGVPISIIDKFSRRRDAIEHKAAELGITSAEGKHAIGYYGREHKNVDLAKAELRRRWRERLKPDESAAMNAVIAGESSGDRRYTAAEAKEYALAHSFEKASTVSEKRLKAEALKFAVGSVLPEDVADIARHPEVIAEMKDGQLMTTTRTVLRDEVSMLQFAKDGQRQCRPLLHAEDLPEDALHGLSDEQRKAALHVLTSRDTVTGIVGKAGTGKTRMMRATVDVIEGQAGKKVFAFAPSAQASRGVLAKEGFKDATTLETLLKSEKLQDRVKGQIIWVDEAGLVSSRDMKRLMDVVMRSGSRVILSGDYTQHASVEAGDAFRLLEQEAGVRMARLTEVRRQTQPGYKKAVEAIAKGSGQAAQKGFDALNRMGWIVEATGEDRHGMLVGDYLTAVDEGKSALIVSPTHAEAARLTAELRDTLRARGALGKDRDFKIRKHIDWSEAQKGDGRNYEPGMIVEFHQNAKGITKGDKAVVIQGPAGPLLQKEDGARAPLPLDTTDRFEVYRPFDVAIAQGDRIRNTKNGEARIEGKPKATALNNGDIYTVQGFDRDGNIRIGDGKLLPKTFGHFALGYVDTSYAAQGKTVDRVFIAAGGQSLPAMGQQAWYVSTTRGREMAKVYVDSKEEMRDAIARKGERLSAVELTRTKLRSSWRRRFQESFERIRVGSFLRRHAEALADQLRGRRKGQEGMSYG